MKKRMLVIAAAVAATTMMVASPVMAEDFKVGICNYVDDASLNQIVDNIQSRLEELGKEKGVTFDVSYDNCNADASVMEQIISDFQADKVDLMVGVATPVAMRMQSATEGSDRLCQFMGASADCLCCLITIHNRHLHIHQDHVIIPRSRLFKCFQNLFPIFTDGTFCTFNL